MWFNNFMILTSTIKIEHYSFKTGSNTHKLSVGKVQLNVHKIWPSKIIISYIL